MDPQSDRSDRARTSRGWYLSPIVRTGARGRRCDGVVSCAPGFVAHIAEDRVSRLTASETASPDDCLPRGSPNRESLHRVAGAGAELATGPGPARRSGCGWLAKGTDWHFDPTRSAGLQDQTTGDRRGLETMAGGRPSGR